MGRVPRPLCALLAVAAVLGLASPAVATAAARWRWPVRGAVVDRYRYDERTPFLRGERRGIVIAAPAGATVRSACDGRVSFGGTVARAGGIVSVRCGGLTASYVRLADVSVRRGDHVTGGDRLGTLGARGLHFGARWSDRRWAYVDPLSLLGDPGARVPLPPLPAVRGDRPPLGPAPAAPRIVPVPAAVEVRQPEWAPRAAPVAGAKARVPALAWLGVGLLLVALPGWGLRASWRRRTAADAHPAGVTGPAAARGP